MNLRDKVGQLLTYRMPFVTELTPRLADFLVETRAGGLCMFGYNIPSLTKISQFNQDLQDLATRHGLPPFILSIDEEGGQVSRMPGEGQALIAPSQMAQAQVGAQTVHDAASVTARKLHQLGFNMNYAPVLDINSNPANPVIGTRSFGDDPEIVATLGAVAIKAYLEAGLSPCVKHFPGHGDTNVDSHYGLPIVNKTLDELRACELVPFQRAIEAGVPAIMSAHIVYPQVEPSGLPATLSYKFLTELLRQELGFEGLIVTDALDMGAISDRYGLAESSLIALNAGADLLLSFREGTYWLENQRDAFRQLVEMVEAGQIDIAQIDQKVARLEKWRAQFAQAHAEPTPEHDYEIISEAARQSIKVVHGDLNSLPTRSSDVKRPLLIDFTAGIESPVEEGRLPGPLLEQQLQTGLPTLARLGISVATSEAEAARVKTWATQSDLLIIVTRNATRYPQQAQLVQDLLANQSNGATATPVVIVAREPYDLGLFPNAPVALLTYGDQPTSIRALANLLLGK